MHVSWYINYYLLVHKSGGFLNPPLSAQTSYMEAHFLACRISHGNVILNSVGLAPAWVHLHLSPQADTMLARNLHNGPDRWHVQMCPNRYVLGCVNFVYTDLQSDQRVKQPGTDIFDQLLIMCLGISTLPAASQTKVFFKRPFLHFALRKILYSFMITLEG